MPHHHSCHTTNEPTLSDPKQLTRHVLEDDPVVLCRRLCPVGPGAVRQARDADANVDPAGVVGPVNGDDVGVKVGAREADIPIDVFGIWAGMSGMGGSWCLGWGLVTGWPRERTVSCCMSM
jgi:hypothetical protein